MTLETIETTVNNAFKLAFKAVFYITLLPVSVLTLLFIFEIVRG